VTKTVFILGAGVSAPAGAPVMKDFLDRAWQLFISPPDVARISMESFQTVFGAFKDLQRVRQNALLNLENIETFFSSVELARLIGRFPGTKELKEVGSLYEALITLIVQTIEYTMPFPVVNRRVAPNGDFGAFTGLIYDLRESTIHKDFAFITFNYDIGLDFALSDRGIPFDYWLEGHTIPRQSYPLLKLHGSINWGFCPGCVKVVAGDVKDISSSRNVSPGTKMIYATLGSRIPKTKHDDGRLLEGPLLVPPVVNKTEHQVLFREVWMKAAQVLAEAENIFVIGYSLPETDLFFRYLLALGLVDGEWVRRFWVFNPDAQVEGQFRRFVGPSIEPRFKYFCQSLEAAISTLRGELKHQV